MTGVGNISASLYGLATYSVNKFNLTQDEIIVTGYETYPGVIQTLTGKGFSEAQFPE